MNENDQLNSVLEKIQEIVKLSAKGDYLYRGEPECYDKVSSSLYRKHSDIEAENFDIEAVQEEILEAAKRYTTETDDFEILTELQHYGGATNLIDFTTDYLIALFFACDGSDFLNEDGRIILLQKTGEINEQVKFPQNPINRVIAQKSIFVRPSKGFIDPDHVINIPKDLKQPILNHLQKYHNISTNTIYNDLHGFILYQNVHQSASAEFFKGIMSQEKKDYSKAIEHYNNAIKLNPKIVNAYNNRGIAYCENDEVERAIKDYNKAIELDPNKASFYSNRGVAYSKRGEVERAIKDYNKAIELNPNYDKAYFGRGIVYVQKEEFVTAIEDLNKAIELNPNYNNLNKIIELIPEIAEAYLSRGIFYREKEEFETAINDLNKAIELNPEHAEAYFYRGIVYGQKEEFEPAIGDLNKAIELGLESAEAYLGRGFIYFQQKEFESAIDDLNKAIELNPEFAEAYLSRGIVYFQKGEFESAIDDYNKAIELNPELAEAYFDRGIYWLYLQKWQEARSDLTVAKNKGADIIKEFRDDFKNVAEFEQKYGVKLPEDIAAMLTQE